MWLNVLPAGHKYLCCVCTGVIRLDGWYGLLTPVKLYSCISSGMFSAELDSSALLASRNRPISLSDRRRASQRWRDTDCVCVRGRGNPIMALNVSSVSHTQICLKIELIPVRVIVAMPISAWSAVWGYERYNSQSRTVTCFWWWRFMTDSWCVCCLFWLYNGLTEQTHSSNRALVWMRSALDLWHKISFSCTNILFKWPTDWFVFLSGNADLLCNNTMSLNAIFQSPVNTQTKH